MKKTITGFLALCLALAACRQGSSNESGDALRVQAAPFKSEEKSKSTTVKAEVRSDGIFYGDKGLIIHDKGFMTLTAGGQKLGDFFFFFNTPWSPWISTNFRGLEHSGMKRNLPAKRFVFTGKIPLEKRGTENMPMANYKQTVQLTKDDRIQIDIEYSCPDKKKIKDRGLFFSMPFAICQGMRYEIDGKIKEFPEKTGEKTADVYSGRPKKFVFSPNVSKSEFGIDIQSNSAFFVRDRKTSVNLRLQPDKKQKISFVLDLRKIAASSLEKSTDSYAGIDFWKSDRLHVPNFDKTKNLVQNPSFESGLRYYILHDTWGEYNPSDKPIYSTDNSQSKFGQSSLRLLVRKKYPKDGYLQTFAIPVKKDKKYTVSFYVKGEYAKGLRLNLRCISAKWMQFPKLGSCGVTKNWKRHSFTFTAPNQAATVLLRGRCGSSVPAETGKIWIDGLQLEEGEKATAYVENPLSARLITSSPDNFLSLKDKISATLEIVTKSEAKGTVACSVEDYFGRKIWGKKFSFKSDKKGAAHVSLPLDGKLGKGIFVLRVDFELEDGYKDSDFFRISRMEFLENKHRNKNICASNFWQRCTRFNDIVERAKYIGMGSTNYVKPKKMITDIYRKNGVYISGLGIFSHGEKASKEMTIKIKKLSREISKWKKMTPEREKIVEDASFKVARSMPWIDSWFFAGECEAGGCKKYKMLESGNIKDFVKLLVATYKGVKRFDKNKKVDLCGGPCNMMPQGGIRWLDRYLEAVGGKVKFDGVAIHPYRTVPEDPDLDDDTAKLLEMLNKHGYDDVPIYWNEGIYYAPYNVPAWGLSPHKGCSIDHYRAFSPSYHMGWAERISAAYFARSWLVALKYQDRVKQFNGWCSWMQMDAYLTPFALQKIPNTLGHILGNAAFKEDIRFAPGIRCYVFEDEKKRPVAAIWSHLAKVDRGLEKCPVAKFTFGGDIPEFIDLMGNNRSVAAVDGKIEVPIASAPLFIRGGAGTLKELCEVLRKAKLKGAKQSPIQVSAKPLSESELDVSFKNLVSRKFEGEIKLNVQGEDIDQKLSMKPQESIDLRVPLKKMLSAGRITKVSVPITIKEKGEKGIKANASFQGFAVKKLKGKINIDCSFEDWKGIPEIKLKSRTVSKLKIGEKGEKIGYKGDFEAFFRVAWDREHLYLAVRVQDDKFMRSPDKHGRYGWYNDTLQVYIDTLGDARSRATKGFDGNDYNYDFFPDPEKGSAVAFRRFAPEQQIAGGLLAPKPNMVEPNVKTAFKLVKGGYIYEVAFPKRYIAPLQLKAGTVAGFALFLNDRDGKRVKACLTLTPPGTGCYMNPHLYPVMLLVE